MREQSLFRPYRIAGAGARFAYTMVDAILFWMIWQFVVEYTRVRPPFGFMQRYKPADYEAYLTVMSWMTLALFLLSFVLHVAFGASLGKLVAGYRTVRTSGARMPVYLCFLRSFGLFVIGLMILAPGPLIAYVFGEGSEISSSSALMLGLVVWIFLAWLPAGGPVDGASSEREVTILERFLGIMTVKLDRSGGGYRQPDETS